MPVGALAWSALTRCKRCSKSLVSIARTTVSTTPARGWRDYPTGPGQRPAPVLHPCLPCFIRSRSGIANSAAIVADSPGVITPPASCRGDRLHRRGDDVGLQPGLLSQGGTLDRRQDGFTARSRHGARMRSVQSHIASASHARGLQVHGSPTSAARRPVGSTPRPRRRAVKQRRLSSLRHPTRRPRRLPDRLFSNRRPRIRPGGFGACP